MDPRLAISFSGKFCAAILLATLVACGGEDPDKEPASALSLRGEDIQKDPTKAADYLLDFGEALVGSRTTVELIMANGSGSSLTVDIGVEELATTPFAASTGSAQIGANRSRPLDITFAPTEDGDFEAILNLKAGSTTRKLRLVGQSKALDCQPSDLDLGYVMLGETATGTITCQNNLGVAVELVLGKFVEVTRTGFAANFAGKGDRTEVEAGESVDIELSFTATNDPGEASARLPILNEQNQETTRVGVRAVALRETLQVLVEENGERVPLQACHNFPATGLERDALQTFFLRNLGEETMAITGFELDGSADHFSVVSPDLEENPVSLAPGEDMEFVVRYAPLSSEDHRSSVMISASGPSGSEVVEACVRGSSAFPSILCDPGALDFGAVAVNTTVGMSFTCSVVMLGTPGGTVPRIKLESVDTTDSQFTATFRDLAAGGYAPGESFIIDVDYRPTSAGAHATVVELVSDARGTPTLPLDVVGEGRTLSPCAFEVGPGVLDFSLVEPGQQKTLTAYVVNTSSTEECLVNNLRLGEDTDSAFSMETVPNAVLPPAGTSAAHRFPVSVTFAPTEADVDYEGSVDFYISHPSQNEQSISLVGSGGTNCVRMDLQSADFGASPAQCAGRPMRVSIANLCGEDLSVTDLSVDDIYSHYSLGDLPSLPAPLPDGGRLEFALTLEAGSDGVFEGAVQASFEGDTISGRAIEGVSGFVGTVHNDRFEANQLDILWVVGATADTSDAQLNIGLKVEDFLRDADGTNYRMGVTTTNVAYMESVCTDRTGFQDPEDGRLVPHPSRGEARVVHAGMSLAELKATFASNMNVGTCGGGEVVYEAARRALSAPWALGGTSIAGNREFLRPEAGLAIIGVTVEADADSFWEGQSEEDNSVARYVSEFKKRKPSWLQDQVKVHMISGGASGCTGAATCTRCAEGAEQTGGHSMEICLDEEDWGPALRNLSADVFSREPRFALRAKPGDRNGDTAITDGDFTVRVAGSEVPPISATSGLRVWNYDAADNSIVFTANNPPRLGQVVEVIYLPACAN